MLIELALFIAGLVFGSFLNVCITRIPRDESVVRPRSHCRNCGEQLRWSDNIPLVGFLILRGRCRECGSRIALRYFAVELLTGIAWAGCYAFYGPTWATVKFCIFAFLLIGLIFMDAETGLLVHEFTYSGTLVGLIFAWITPVDAGGTRLLSLLFHWHIPNVRVLSFVDSLIGALFAGGFFYLTWAAYYLIRKRHGLGFGDVALMAMCGAFLGLKLVTMVIFCAPLLAVGYIAVLLIMQLFEGRKKQVQETGGTELDEPPEAPSFLQREIPFGVFLGGCALAAIYFGEAAWNWYFTRL